MKQTTVTIKKFEDKQRKGKERRIKGRRKSKVKIQRFLLTGDAPYVKKVEKKGRN